MSINGSSNRVDLTGIGAVSVEHLQRAVNLANAPMVRRATVDDSMPAETMSFTGVYSLLTAFIMADEQGRVDVINSALSAVEGRIRIETVNGVWRTTFHTETSYSFQITADTALGLSELLRTGEHSRLGMCAAPGCSHVRFDRTRNRSRIYCSSACANRVAVAAHRARRTVTGRIARPRSPGG